MSQRDAVTMSPAERDAFLVATSGCTLATLDPNGFPHLVAMEFVYRDGCVYMTSYAKAQKVKNIERDPRVAVMVETGDSYEALRAVMIRGHCDLLADPELAVSVIRGGAQKKDATWSEPPAAALASAAKRLVLRVKPKRWVTWDHTKLGGRY